MLSLGCITVAQSGVLKTSETIKGHVEARDFSRVKLHMNIKTQQCAFEREDFMETIKVLIAKPGEKPEVAEIENNSDTMQTIIGGRIKSYMPYEDKVVVVCSDEELTDGMAVNKVCPTTENGIVNVIAGTFILCYAPDEKNVFQSLPEDLLNKYLNLL